MFLWLHVPRVPCITNIFNTSTQSKSEVEPLNDLMGICKHTNILVQTYKHYIIRENHYALCERQVKISWL